MFVGISDIQLFFPKNSLDFQILVKEREKENPIWKDKLEQALKLTGQKNLRFPYRDQDSVTLGAEALYKLLKNNQRDLSHLRVLISATETTVDHSKSLSSYIVEALEKEGFPFVNSYATFQVQNACVAGSYGMLSALALLQVGSKKPEGDWGILIASDISRYDSPSTAEITQGAGSAALLLEENPKLLRIDLSSIGYSSQGTDDFFRPLESLTAKVKGRYSIECFSNALREAFLNFCDRKQDYPEVVLSSASMFILHSPYALMPAIALRPLLREFYSEDEEEIENYLISRYVYESTGFVANVGNMYTASIFSSLVLGLKRMYEKMGSEIIGKRIIFASYGSGSSMAVMEMVVTPQAINVIKEWDLDILLSEKRESSWSEYTQWLKGEGLSLRNSLQDSGFFLKEIREDGYRLYERKP